MPTLVSRNPCAPLPCCRASPVRGTVISSYMDSAISVDIMGSRCYSSAHVLRESKQSGPAARSSRTCSSPRAPGTRQRADTVVGASAGPTTRRSASGCAPGPDILRRVAPEEIVAARPDWTRLDAWPYGDLYVLEHLWKQIGMRERLPVLTRDDRRRTLPVERACFAMVATAVAPRPRSSTATSSGSGGCPAGGRGGAGTAPPVPEHGFLQEQAENPREGTVLPDHEISSPAMSSSSSPTRPRSTARSTGRSAGGAEDATLRAPRSQGAKLSRPPAAREGEEQAISPVGLAMTQETGSGSLLGLPRGHGGCRDGGPGEGQPPGVEAHPRIACSGMPGWSPRRTSGPWPAGGASTFSHAGAKRATRCRITSSRSLASSEWPRTWR